MMIRLLKNMNKREQYIAMATALFVLMAVSFNFILHPVFSEWQALNGEIGSKATLLENDMKILAIYKNLESNYSKFSRYVRSDKSEEETVADVLAYLEGLSRGDSCLILNIKPTGTKDFGQYKELLIDLSVEGSTSQITKFLYDIENTKNMILKVRHFSLTSKAGQEGALRGSFLISKIIVD